MKPVVFLVCALGGFLWASYMEQGQFYYKKGNYPAAYQEFLKAEQSGENPTLSQFNQANCLYKMGQSARALQIYLKITRESSDFIRAYINAGGILFQMEEVGEALALYHRAHNLDPQNPILIKMLGETYLKLSQKAKALEYFEKGKKMEPEEVEWLYAILEIYIDLEDLVFTELTLQQATSYFPDVADFPFLLGETAYQNGDKKAASVYFSKGLDLDSTRTTYYSRLAEVQLELNQPYSAITTLEKGLEREVLKSSAYLEIAEIYQNLGDLESAMKAYCIAHQEGEYRARDGVMYLLDRQREEKNGWFFRLLYPQAERAFPKDPEIQDFKRFFYKL